MIQNMDSKNLQKLFIHSDKDYTLKGFETNVDNFKNWS